MEIALSAARLILIAVFIVAGIAKLWDRSETRRSLTDFGVPACLVSIVAVLLPVTEVATAGLLFPVSTVWWGALAALALLVLFTGAIAFNLLRGRRPACRCFGQLGAGPVSASTLVRNAVLLAVALALVAPGPAHRYASLVSWMSELSTAETVNLAVGLAALLLLATILLVLFQVLGQQGRLLLRLDELERRLSATGHAPIAPPAVPPASVPEGLPFGAPAPDFTLPDITGRPATLTRALDLGQPVLLLFTDPECAACTSLLPDIGGWQQDLAPSLTVLVISRGAASANRAKSAEHGIAPVLLQQDYEVADLYRVYATPSAVLVRPDGTIGSPLAGGPDQIRSLVLHTVTAPADNQWQPPLQLSMVHQHPPQPTAPTPQGLAIGSLAPTFELPGTQGEVIKLADFRDEPVLLVFWSPNCGFCHQLLPDLRAWEQTASTGTPRLILVSQGSADEHASLNLRAPIALDQDLRVGASFGISGTPSAVLLDADGKVASELAIGGAEVLALAGTPASAQQASLS
ncbi:MAG: MauE/DoxX family redox-associated membrane protein [Chloroflexota bacterium]